MCEEAARLLALYTSALSAFQRAQRAVLGDSRKPVDPEFGLALEGQETAQRTLLEARHGYWNHVRSHGCRQTKGRPRAIQPLPQPDLDLLWRQFQHAKNQLDLAHNGLNDALELNLSSEIPSSDGQHSYRSALQTQELAASKYLQLLSDLRAAAVPFDGQGNPGRHTNQVPVGIELLTPREVEVLALIASGKSGREVAELLGISFKTVFVHRQKIYAKLQVHKVTDLIRIAMRMGLIEG